MRLSRHSEEFRALSWTSAPLQGFQPVAPADPSPGRLLPWGSSPLRRRSIAGPVHPGLPHPAPSDLRVWIPSRRLAPCARIRSEDRTPSLGFTLQGLCTLQPAAPVSGPWPSCRFRLTRPSPLRTKRSSDPPRLQDFAPAEEPSPSGRSNLPSGPCPRGSPSSPKLWPHRAGPGFPGPPLMCFLVGSGRSRRRRRHSRVSGAARSGELSRVHRLP